MIIPVVGMGIAAQYIAATTAMAWFTGLMIALLPSVLLKAFEVLLNLHHQDTVRVT
jgi:hypothetical protein